MRRTSLNGELRRLHSSRQSQLNESQLSWASRRKERMVAVAVVCGGRGESVGSERVRKESCESGILEGEGGCLGWG